MAPLPSGRIFVGFPAAQAVITVSSAAPLSRTSAAVVKTSSGWWTGQAQVPAGRAFSGGRRSAAGQSRPSAGCAGLGCTPSKAAKARRCASPTKPIR
jgi:hypothetical protein